MILRVALPSPAGPSPAKSVTVPKTDLREIIGAVAHGVWAGASSSVWSALGAIAFLIVVAIQAVHAVVYPRWGRDAVRRFTRQDKAEILHRAGGRCEHHGWLTRRCRQTERLEADHIIPWSRSGPTIIGNGQALCRRHNQTKRATIPLRWQLNAIAKRRDGYFPAGVSGKVARRRPSR